MAWRRGVVVAAAFLLLTVTAAPDSARGRDAAGGPQATQAKPATKPKKTPAEQMAEPWPDAATLARRRADAEGRRLFKTDDPLSFTLAANFRAEWHYRPSRCDVPAVLVYAGKPHNHLGWRKVIPRTLRCVALPDDPGDNHIVQPPNVGLLAEVLGRLLRESQSPPRADLPTQAGS